MIKKPNPTTATSNSKTKIEDEKSNAYHAGLGMRNGKAKQVLTLCPQNGVWPAIFISLRGYMKVLKCP